MPALKKKPLTKVSVMGDTPRTFLIPEDEVKNVIRLIEKKAVEEEGESAPWEEMFKDRFKKIGKPAVMLRGARTKEGMSQVQLAEKLDIDQADLSKMENGKRPIGKKMAKKLGKILRIHYQLFL